MKIDRRCWAKALAATWALSLLSAGGIALTDTAGAEEAAQTSEYAQIEVEYKNKDLDTEWNAAECYQITLDGDSVQCPDGVTYADGRITITQPGDYLISGMLNDGCIYIAAGDEDDVRLILNGATISASDGPAIWCESADKLIITLAEGAQNALSDGQTYSDQTDDEPNATLYSRSDLSINGTGALAVTGNYLHGILSKDDLKIAGGQITVDAAGDALRGRDGVAICGGTLDLTAGDDGIQSNYEDDATRGWVVIEDGTITIDAQGDGIVAESVAQIEGGTLDITTGGGAAVSDATGTLDSMPEGAPATGDVPDAPMTGDASDSDSAAVGTQEMSQMTAMEGNALPDASAHGTTATSLQVPGNMASGKLVYLSGDAASDGTTGSSDSGDAASGASTGSSDSGDAASDVPTGSSDSGDAASDVPTGSSDSGDAASDASAGSGNPGDAASDASAGSGNPGDVPSDVPADRPSDVPSDVPADRPSDMPGGTPPEGLEMPGDGGQFGGGGRGGFGGRGGMGAGSMDGGMNGGYAGTTQSATNAESAKAIKSTGAVYVSGGTLTLNAADDALHSNGDVTVTGGVISIATGDDAVHADATLTIGGGTMDITQSYEGLEGVTIDISAGDISIVSSDDGINAAGGNDESGMTGMWGRDQFAAGDQQLNISGGNVSIVAGGDGIDSNGDIYMSGGCVYVTGPANSGNGALDYAGVFEVSGGELIAAGPSGMAQSVSDSSSQAAVFVKYASSQPGGERLTLVDAQGNVVATYAPERQYDCVVISAPGIQVGGTYLLYAGGEVSGSVLTGGEQLCELSISGTLTSVNSDGSEYAGRSFGRGGR